MNTFHNHQFVKQDRKYNNYYINRFISLKSSTDMMINRLFPNAKEITESFAAFEATTHLDPEFNWANQCVVVCVGDGHTPRTGGVFAYRTRWTVHSVDPLMKKNHYPINRLTCHQKHIQDLSFEFDLPTLICCVHSHAKLSFCLKSIKAPLINIINIPCCVKPDIQPATISYLDKRIWSEKNLVEIYKM